VADKAAISAASGQKKRPSAQAAKSETSKGGRRSRASGAESSEKLLPEDHLQRAVAATTPRSRGTWARRGLAHRGRLDRTTQTMLLRQLYLSHYAQSHFERAYEIAVQATELEVLTDVMHQDAARAKQASGEIDDAVGHLRLAARLSPPSRRPFHWWTLGSILFLAERYAEAISALSRAARWGTTDKPLYQGHLALAKRTAGFPVRNLNGLIQRLEQSPCGQGYGRFVLGHLAFRAERWDEAESHLKSFLARTKQGRKAMAIALAAEVQMSRETLRAIESR
jgi:tetratricopeptide (TPR) repeat protein